MTWNQQNANDHFYSICSSQLLKAICNWHYIINLWISETGKKPEAIFTTIDLQQEYLSKIGVTTHSGLPWVDQKFNAPVYKLVPILYQLTKESHN